VGTGLNHPEAILWWVKAETSPEETPKAGGVSSHPAGELGRGIHPPRWSLCGWVGVKSRHLRAGIPRMGI